MKFLCPSCRAKYQIADEKVSGRTLKMACRQCGSDVVIRGDENLHTSEAVTTPSGQGLVAALQQHTAVGTDSAPQDVWHLAINNVPVGPMRREEVARRIAMGAVDQESLAWREGFEDWLPIAEIPELSSLWRPQRRVSLPVPPPAAVPAAGPFGGYNPPTAPSQSFPAPAVDPENGVATGTPQAPQLSEPLPAEREVHERKRAGWGPLFLLVCGGASVLAVGAFLGARVWAPPVTPQVTTPAAAPPEAPPPKAQLEPLSDTSGDNDNGESLIVLEPQDIAGEPEDEAKAGRRRTQARRKKRASGRAQANQLTDEEREKLARMGGDFRDPSALKRTGSPQSGREARGSQQGLNAAQLVKVVTKGKHSLQRCYETALRGSGSSDTVRLDVRITVSPNGNVTRVTTTGKSLPGMDKCISNTARTWRFPKSSGPSTTEFPVLFHPGA